MIWVCRNGSTHVVTLGRTRLLPTDLGHAVYASYEVHINSKSIHIPHWCGRRRAESCIRRRRDDNSPLPVIRRKRQGRMAALRNLKGRKLTCSPSLVSSSKFRLYKHSHIGRHIKDTYLYWWCVALERGKVHGPMLGDIFP